MRVTTMSLVSRTIVDFQGESGQSVQVVNGTAFYMFIPPGGVRPVSYVVCAADGTPRARFDMVPMRVVCTVGRLC